jgi:RNA polymerase sigma-70 factor (ECF subfamily)
MFDEKEEVFYQNEDYTVRMKKIDGIEKYFIKFNLTDSPENEISLDIFMLYFQDKDFRKPLDRQRNQSRRHTAKGDSEYHVLTNYRVEDEDTIVLKSDIETVLKTCTPTQQKRFNLHYIQNYSFTEIAKMENCDESSVRETIKSVLKKIKKYFY